MAGQRKILPDQAVNWFFIFNNQYICNVCSFAVAGGQNLSSASLIYFYYTSNMLESCNETPKIQARLFNNIHISSCVSGT